jgi:exodeoxyribonuclease V gamma subunit
MAVPNPCRYHWADTIDGRELLRLQQRRQPLRGGRDLAAVPLQDMHAHGHPLLSAWGRQAATSCASSTPWEDSSALRQRLGTPRVDLFDEQPAGQGTLLQQVQAGVRDLLPPPNSHAARWPTPTAPSSSMSPTAPSARWRCCTTSCCSCWPTPPGGRRRCSRATSW